MQASTSRLTRNNPQKGEVLKIDQDTKNKPKADVTINVSDDVFQQLADGKLNGQKVRFG